MSHGSVNPAGPYGGYGLPYWLDFDRPRFGPLEGDATADVAIVGAGIAGLKLAHHLLSFGVGSIVLEAGLAGDGASGRNQGSINHGTSAGYAQCIAKFGRPNARSLWQLGIENQKLACAQIEGYAIDCGYDVLGMTLMARRDMEGWESALEEYRADTALLRQDGFDAEFLDAAALRGDGQSPLMPGGIRHPTDAQFHSGRYVGGLAVGVSRSPLVRLHDETRVLRIDEDGPSAVRVTTTRGTVSAGRVFLGVNALAPQFVPALAPGLRAERGQVLVTKPLERRPCRGSYGTAQAWWREVPEPDGRFRLLFGGGRRRDEPDSLFRQFDDAGRADPALEREGFCHSDAHQRRLDEQFAALFPQLRGALITHRWGGLQSFTADSLPMIGTFDPARRIHGMAGFCGRGNAHSDAGAQYLAGKVAGVTSPIERRFGRLIDELLTPGRASANWSA